MEESSEHTIWSKRPVIICLPQKLSRQLLELASNPLEPKSLVDNARQLRC